MTSTPDVLPRAVRRRRVVRRAVGAIAAMELRRPADRAGRCAGATVADAEAYRVLHRAGVRIVSEVGVLAKERRSRS
jgi:hypothetical protein